MALTPLLPSSMRRRLDRIADRLPHHRRLYYFAGMRALWGRTIGGAIFDVRTAKTKRVAR